MHFSRIVHILSATETLELGTYTISFKDDKFYINQVVQEPINGRTELIWICTVPHTNKNRIYNLILDKNYVTCNGNDIEASFEINYCACFHDMLILADKNKNIEVWQTFKQILWDWKEETNPSTTIEHMIIEMMYTRECREKSFETAACLYQERDKKIMFKFKDTKKELYIRQFNDWCSEYLNTLLLGHPEDEIFSFFENLTHDEFTKMDLYVWRANEMHLMDYLVFLGGTSLYYRCKMLYDNMKEYSAYPVSTLLDWFL